MLYCSDDDEMEEWEGREETEKDWVEHPSVRWALYRVIISKLTAFYWLFFWAIGNCIPSVDKCLRVTLSMKKLRN